MKKVIALLMVCGFALAFVACGGQKAETSADAVDSVSATSADSAASAKVDSTVNADTTKVVK